MANDPIHQFQIHALSESFDIMGYPISFTNSALFMGLSVFTITALLLLSARKSALVPGRFQNISEIWYQFVHNMVAQVLGADGAKFFPLVFSLFSFVLFANLLGMFPYFFTITSHLVVTAALAVFVVGLVIVIGVGTHGFKWFKLFVPSGVPLFILPFISLIEIISFLSRPVSLALRLFGNMLAGHIILKVFAGFVASLAALGIGGVIGSVAPLIMVVALTALEFLVAFLQAFVFAILACVYLNDALHPGH